MAALLDPEKMREALKEFFGDKTTYHQDRNALYLMKNDGYYGVEFMGFGRDDGAINWSRELTDARDFSSYDNSELAKIYAKAARKSPDTHYAFVSLNLRVDFKKVDMESEEMIEALRASALAKLSEAEIRALGAEKLAVYNKLKFHEGKKNGK